jgi:hypothetical protein
MNGLVNIAFNNSNIDDSLRDALSAAAAHEYSCDGRLAAELAADKRQISGEGRRACGEWEWIYWGESKVQPDEWCRFQAGESRCKWCRAGVDRCEGKEKTRCVQFLAAFYLGIIR